jgi:hypothetical protein
MDPVLIPHTFTPFEGAPCVWLEGPFTFHEAVSGASFYQPHLEWITGRADLYRYPLRVGAWLKAEADNPHDPTSVLVWVRGGKVGHLPRARAALWHPLLRALGHRYGAFAGCHAEIRGGWVLEQPERDGRTRALYGVKLLLPVNLT